jgi:DNA topoisomerase-2
MPPKKALAPADTLSVNAPAVPAAPAATKAPAGNATIEDTYQKLTQHQHILQRPDTYVGSIESVTSEMHVLHAETQRMEVRKLTYVPGLYKCFDEIVVNAADNKVRDDSQTYIKIKVERDKGRLSV